MLLHSSVLTWSPLEKKDTIPDAKEREWSLDNDTNTRQVMKNVNKQELNVVHKRIWNKDEDGRDRFFIRQQLKNVWERKSLGEWMDVARDGTWGRWGKHWFVLELEENIIIFDLGTQQGGYSILT